MNLKSDNILLRALEPEDLDFLYQIENDELVWEISNTQVPYSKWVLKNYLDNAHKSIFEVQQLRLVICVSNQKKAIGFIDLFDFDIKNSRVGLGIVIENHYQNQGFGKEVLAVICKYVFETLQLHQIYVNIIEDNVPSIKLFTNFGFQKIGVKKDWLKTNNQFKSEMMFQLVNNYQK